MLEVGDVGLMYLCMRTSYRSRVYFLVPQVLQSFRPCLRGGNGMKRIVLEYFSFILFWSFNGENEKSIFLFGSLSGRE